VLKGKRHAARSLIAIRGVNSSLTGSIIPPGSHETGPAPTRLPLGLVSRSSLAAGIPIPGPV
jgi:hypothetical protein